MQTVAGQDGVWTLVLAGGDGTRLQALTQRISGVAIPKQYCRMLAGRSLLEATLDRVRRLAPPRRTLTVVTRHHLPVAEEQLAALPRFNVLVQPRNRDTGPGLLFSLLRIARRQPDGVVAVFPSDHYVADETAFHTHVERATRLVGAMPERIVLLGIAPTDPDVGLGYIEPAEPIALDGVGEAFRVAAFREKPSHADADRLVAGGALWNSFVMVFRLRRVLDLLERIRPADVLRMRATRRGADAAYDAMPPWNFSRDFLAHVPEELVVLRVDGTGWSDWGTPESVARTLEPLAG